MTSFDGYDRRYLAKVPNGYCGRGGTGGCCQVRIGVESTSADG